MDMLTTFLIVCPLVGLAGFVDAIAGGGGLITVPAYLMTGMPVHMAFATNKMSSVMGTALATFRLATQGYLKPRLAALPVAAGLMGSAAGASLNLIINDDVLRMLLLVVLPLTALYLMQPRSLQENPDRRPLGTTVALSTVIALAIGVYDGFYGPGTGTFLLILFTGICKMTLNDAAGTTKAVNLTTNFAALVVFLVNGQVWLLLGLVAGACNMIGAYLGVSMLTKKGTKIAKPLILAVLTLFFVKTSLELLGVI